MNTNYKVFNLITRKEGLAKRKERSFLNSLSVLLVFATLSSLLLTLFFIVCHKNPTAPNTGTLTGTVLLEGQTDHSGISVAFTPLDIRTEDMKDNENMKRIQV